MEITYYHPSSGHIEHSKMSSYPGATPEIISGLEYIQGIWDPMEYYIDGVPLPRPLMQPTLSATTVCANGEAELLLANIPSPAAINIDSTWYLVNDGEVTLVFDTPGTYSITIESFPYKPWEVTIHAT